MRLSSWLSVFRKKIRRSEHHRRAVGRRDTECLEQRTLLTVSGVLIGTELTILADGPDSVAVRRGATGRVEVLANGVVSNSIANIQASALTGLHIFAADADNTIDLSAVSSTTFAALSTIEVDAGHGNDQIVGPSNLAASLSGHDGDDSIVGGSANDTLDGGNGNDTVNGGLGNDLLIGDDGTDQIDGGLGDDRIDAGDGNDNALGGAGNDTVDSGQGEDTVDGGTGNDSILAGQGADSVDGGDGNDTVIGGTENDTVQGGLGDDTISGQAGRDVLLGDAGNDSLNGGTGNDSLDGAGGNDFLLGDADDDTLQGGSGNDAVVGAAGNDLLNGGFGNDTTLGNGGNDTLNGGGDSDILNGGAGADRIESGDAVQTTAVTVSIGDATVTAEGDSGAATLFAAAADAPVAGTTHDRIVSGDFDGDGDLDLASERSVTFNNGAGIFANPIAITTNATGFMDVGDIDGDGDLDIVAPTSGGDINILLNAGNGTFGAPQTISFSTTIFSASAVELADLDGDGDLDIAATVGFAVAEVFVMRNNGNGTFAPAVSFQAGTDGSSDVTAADFDGDGDLDLVVTKNFLQSNVAFLRNNGNATFSGAVIVPVSAAPLAISAGDLDNDGDLDFATAGSSVSVVLNNGSGNFAPSTGFNGAGFFSPNDLEIADFDGDGDNDIVGVTFNSEIELYDNDGSAGFTNSFVFPDAAGGFGTDLATGDFNGDGDLDVAYARGLSSTALGVRFNTGIVPIFGVATVSLSDASSNVVTVQFSMANALATNGTDFSGFSGTVTFQPGQTTQTIAVPIIGDTTAEPNENFLINLSNATNATIGDGQGQITIIDDDGGALLPTLAINNVSVNEGNAGTTTMTFTVTLSAAPTGSVSVGFATQDGTATAGSDYTAASGTLSFDAANLSRTVAVTVFGDTTSEVSETLFVNLLNPVGVLIADTSGQGTITNDDGVAVPTTPHDTLDGDLGNDTLIGSFGNDLLRGGDQNDLLDGGSGNDLLQGGSGADRLVGGLDDDTLNGQTGNDTLSGTDGSDIYLWDGANAGNDVLAASSGFESLLVQGDASGETFVVSQVSGLLRVAKGTASITANTSVANVTINANRGDDTVTVQSLNNVRPLLLTINGEADFDTVNATGANLGGVVLVANGGDGNDTLTGSVSGERLRGDAGDDVISGNAGNDQLDGGDGNDSITGGDGNDSANGGIGNDTLFGGKGHDTLNGDSGNDFADGEDDHDVVQGQDGNDTLVGNYGNDTIRGHSGNDFLFGGAGNDAIDGGVGNDNIRGHSGNDKIKGGHGDDTISGDQHADTIDGGDGNDSIQSGDAFTTLGDIVSGGDGNDTLLGGSHNDTLLGGDGNDAITAGAGNDMLFGGDGDDRTNGNGGSDQFNTGEGVDSTDASGSEFDNPNLVIPTSVLQALATLNGF